MTAYVIHANLDCEAVWSGAALPPAVARRVSHYAALLAALAPADATSVEIWTPAAVDAPRLGRVDALPWPLTMYAGAPPRADIAWANPAARTANDRRLALEVAAAHGAALPGARAIASPDEIDLPGPWVCKALWTSAGRDRCRGTGAPTPAQRVRIERLIARGGAAVLEPWCERIFDAGVCAHVTLDGLVTAHPPHALLTDARGGFAGIDLAPPPLEPDERAQLSHLVAAAGAALAERGYTGPFAIDAFAYRDGDRRRFRALCEINARYTFGWIARALASRLGTQRLGFGPPPPGATILIVPATDGIAAWCM